MPSDGTRIRWPMKIREDSVAPWMSTEVAALRVEQRSG